MGYFNRHYFTDSSGNALSHSANKTHAKYGTVGSTSSEKGTDNKKNNTSEYNHDYYEGNKDKWADNKSSKKSSSKKKNASKSDDDDLFYDKDGKARFGHKDYDENDEDFKRTDGEKIEGTELRTFTNKNGSTIIVGNGIKFSFPPGTKITKEMAKRIASVESGDKKNKEQYVAKMLNAVTGFADKQKLDVGGKKTSSKKTEKTEEAKAPETKKDEGLRNWNQVKTDYYKKKKTLKHSDDLGSVLVRDLY
jgi:hypothetical protein